MEKGTLYVFVDLNMAFGNFVSWYLVPGQWWGGQWAISAKKQKESQESLGMHYFVPINLMNLPNHVNRMD